MLKIIFISSLIFFTLGTDIKTVGNVYVSAKNSSASENHVLSLNSQETDGTSYLDVLTTDVFNQKQSTKKKNKLIFFPCCFQFKSKQKKSQTIDELPETSINTKIQIKSKNNFDQTRNSQRTSLDGMKASLKMMRKSSVPTQRISSPIQLSRRLSGESVKSAILLSRKSSAESVKTAILLSRKSSEIVKSPIMLSRTSSVESAKAPNRVAKRYTAKSKNYLENPNKPYTKQEEVKEISTEKTSKPRDLRSYSCKNVLLYVCLDENVENCQKCKKLKQIFESKNSEQNYLLYNLPLQKLQNPTELDLKNIPTWLELVLWSILSEKQDMNLYITLKLEDNIETNYQSKTTYSLILRKFAQVQPLGGHIFFSVLKSNFLEDIDLKFFLENKIINYGDNFIKIGENEGVTVIDGEKYTNTFLFDGILEEVKPDYTPAVGNVVVTNKNHYSYYEDQMDMELIPKGTLLTVEKIDPLDSWILVSHAYKYTNGRKQQWISPEDFMNIIEQKF